MSFLDKLFGRRRVPGDQPPPYSEALDRGDFIAAVPLLQEAIKHEDTRAMIGFGVMLVLGRGVERDPLEGLAWIRQAAVRGDLRGQLMLGMYLMSGIGVSRDDSEAAHWLFRAAKGGLIEAANHLSDLVLRNPKVVGEHFSQDEFMAVLKRAHRPQTQVVH